ncbi:MAG: hypothetical protein CSA81_08680, partial [Acidobacteria bacterium]
MVLNETLKVFRNGLFGLEVIMKKSRLASILVLLLLSCSTFAQQKTKQFDPNEGTGKVPKLVILKTDHDFGKIDKTQKVTAQFKFKNEGDGILQIKDV